jgi:hypothetical protein
MHVPIGPLLAKKRKLQAGSGKLRGGIGMAAQDLSRDTVCFFT